MTVLCIRMYIATHHRFASHRSDSSAQLTSCINSSLPLINVHRIPDCCTREYPRCCPTLLAFLRPYKEDNHEDRGRPRSGTAAKIFCAFKLRLNRSRYIGRDTLYTYTPLSRFNFMDSCATGCPELSDSFLRNEIYIYAFRVLDSRLKRFEEDTHLDFRVLRDLIVFFSTGKRRKQAPTSHSEIVFPLLLISFISCTLPLFCINYSCKICT